MHKGGSFEMRSGFSEPAFQDGRPDNLTELSQECKHQLLSLIELIDDAFIVHDKSGYIRMANEAAVRLFNAGNSGDLYGRSVYEFAGGDSAEQIKKSIHKLWSDGVVSEKPLGVEIIQGEGQTAEVELKSFPLLCEKNYETIQTVIRNKSERHLLEQKMMEANRLDLLSTIAGGVAHNFNNFLAVMLGNITMYKKNETKCNADAALDCIENSIMQAKDLSQQLLLYAREGVPVGKTVSVEKLLRNITRFTLSGTSVFGEVIISGKLCQVDINEGQMAQVLNNLLINAVQAMPEGGTVIVEAVNIPASRVCRELSLAGVEKDFLKITVKDEGVGIPEKHIKDIFEPFFTTKKTGVGLGLATTHAIIKKHEGYITVESKPGEGTAFSVYLPVSANPLSEALTPGTEKMLSGYGKILVMEDEEPVRTITGEMLSMLGYEADLACDGKEAIELYIKNKDGSEPYRAVLMDLAIPGGMNGETAIDKLLALDPEASIIISSGYNKDNLEKLFLRKGVKGFIAKPYSVQELSEVLRKVLSVN